MTATYSFPSKIIKTIRKDDPDFHIDNGLVMSPRAGFEISNKCPGTYKLMIVEAIKNGWLQPVAYMKDSEYMWEKLGE
jgi:hypothetical protein